MKEVTKETTQKYTVYQAVDGTEFKDKSECLKYEESAKGVIRARISKLTVGKSNEWELFGGSDDHDVIGVRMYSESDVEHVKQFILLECPWFNNDLVYRTNVFSTIDKAYKDEDIVLIASNCDGDYYFIDSCQNIINKLKSLKN